MTFVIFPGRALLIALAIWCSPAAAAPQRARDAAPRDAAPRDAPPQRPTPDSKPESPPADGDERAPTPAPPLADEARGYHARPGIEPTDVALFLPRLVLTIPRYALKFAFYPVVAGLSFLDRHSVIETVTDILYNDARTAGIVPTLSADTFFGPTLGIKAFHDDLAQHAEQGSIRARFGGRYEQAYQVAFRADRFAGSHLWVESRTRFEIEPALLFQGIGSPPERPSASGLDPRAAAIETRFRQKRLLLLQRIGYSLGGPGALVQLGSTGIFNRRTFAPKTRGSGPSVEEVYDTARLVGYRDGVATLELDANLNVDTRDVAGATSSGVHIEMFGGAVLPISAYRFWHHGFEATAYFDLYRKSRILVMRAVLEAVEGANEDIPFSDLPRLGGPHRLRGYPLDRFRDEKAAVATLEYHYPIHQYVAGSLFVDAGRVAPSYAALLQSDAWKAGVGGGFIVRSQRRILFTMDVAYGDRLIFHVTTDPLRAFASRDTEL